MDFEFRVTLKICSVVSNFRLAELNPNRKFAVFAARFLDLFTADWHYYYCLANYFIASFDFDYLCILGHSQHRRRRLDSGSRAHRSRICRQWSSQIATLENSLTIVAL